MARLADVGGAVVTGEVFMRDDRGRFIAAVEEGAADAAQDMATDLAALIIATAASELRTRTGNYIRSVKPVRLTRTSAAAVIEAPYARPLEEGSSPHDIPNSFGRGPDFGFGPDQRKNWDKGGFPFFHPGNRAYRIGAQAYEAIVAAAPAVIRRRMPGVIG